MCTKPTTVAHDWLIHSALVMLGSKNFMVNTFFVFTLKPEGFDSK